MADASADKGAEVRFPPPFVFLAFILLGVGLHYLVAPIPQPESRWIVILGVLFLVAGAALMAAAVMDFRRTGQEPAPWTPSPVLITRGPYLWTRNPMYLAFTGLQVGLGLVLGNLWISLLAPLSLAVVHVIAVLPEEAYLTRRFGDSYEEYRRRVRRYV